MIQPLVKPRAELDKARVAVRRMQKAADLNSFDEAWKEFLSHLERVWYKTSSHLKGSSKYQGWTERGKTEELRRQDSLLAYLVNARGAEEHSVEDITARTKGGVHIGPAQGNSLYVKEMIVEKGRIYIDSPQPVKISFIPDKVKLLPVINRGRTYDLPKVHLGIDLTNTDAIEIAKLGIQFYEGYLNRLEKYLGK